MRAKGTSYTGLTILICGFLQFKILDESVLNINIQYSYSNNNSIDGFMFYWLSD